MAGRCGPSAAPASWPGSYCCPCTCRCGPYSFVLSLYVAGQFMSLWSFMLSLYVAGQFMLSLRARAGPSGGSNPRAGKRQQRRPGSPMAMAVSSYQDSGRKASGQGCELVTGRGRPGISQLSNSRSPHKTAKYLP
jgi:hypothetical protein